MSEKANLAETLESFVPPRYRVEDEASVKTLSEEIRALAREKNALIIAHSYQLPEVQDVAHYVGDSLGLAQQAQKSDHERIIFCGVNFMAECFNEDLLDQIFNGREVLDHFIRGASHETVVPLDDSISCLPVSLLQEFNDLLVRQEGNTTSDAHLHGTFLRSPLIATHNSRYINRRIREVTSTRGFAYRITC